jgi:hypothetical protein
MDDKRQKPLSDSEIQKLRDDIAEAERRRWLRRLIRTAAAWTAGLAAGFLTLVDAGMRVAEWVTRK